MFLLVPAHPGCPGQNVESRKTVLCVYCSSKHLKKTNNVKNETGRKKCLQNILHLRTLLLHSVPFSALLLLVRQQEWHMAHKKLLPVIPKCYLANNGVKSQQIAGASEQLCPYKPLHACAPCSPEGPTPIYCYYCLLYTSDAADE